MVDLRGGILDGLGYSTTLQRTIAWYVRLQGFLDHEY